MTDAPGIDQDIERVLLVDDDKVTNMMHARLIKRTGGVAQIDLATDGQAALEYLEARTQAAVPWPELILLDINMPRMDGFEFLEAYGALPAQARAGTLVVMLSTSVLRADHDRADADPHVHCFVAKPLQADHLKRFVQACQAG